MHWKPHFSRILFKKFKISNPPIQVDESRIPITSIQKTYSKVQQWKELQEMYSHKSLKMRTFRLLHEDGDLLELENQLGMRFSLPKEIVEINRFPYRDENFVLDEVFFWERFKKTFLEQAKLVYRRVDELLAQNPKAIFGADWILEQNSPYYFVTFPQLVSQMSFLGSYPIFLGKLLEIWKKYPEFHFQDKESGERWYVVRISRSLGGNYQLFAYSPNLNQTKVFSSPLAKVTQYPFSEARCFELFVHEKTSYLGDLSLGYLLLKSFLDEIQKK